MKIRNIFIGGIEVDFCGIIGIKFIFLNIYGVFLEIGWVFLVLKKFLRFFERLVIYLLYFFIVM